jgi:predicted nucleotidyltransferase
MDEISPEIKAIVNRYIHVLEKSDFHIQEAILFGSYASKKYDKWSDIDIALISDDFEGIRFRDKEKIRKITLSVSPMLSPLPFKTENFSDDDPFVHHIKETGLPLK